LLGVIVVLISRLATMPKTFWESDELLFAAALKSFDPWASHPHPPGYPLYVGLGKFAAALTGDAFTGLLAISVIACVGGYLALALAFRRILGDPDLAMAGALVFYFSASMLVNGTLPMSDSAALACAAAAIYAMTFFPHEATERTAIALGLATSAAIGIRPQLVVPLLPVAAVVLASSRDRRKIIAGTLAFAFLSIAWFAPLMDAAGGWDKLVLWETKQAAYVAAHDAAASRGAHSTGEVATRFIFHPWGPKLIALPLAILALLGAAGVWRRRNIRMLPLFAFSLIHLVFALAVMDPADAPRYALPWLMSVALFIACGFGIVRDSARMRSVPLVGAAIVGVVSWMYVAPIVGTRRRQPSPPAAAAAAAKLAPNTVVLYDLSMKPHAEVLFGSYQSLPIDKGLAAHYDHPDVPLVILGDGGSRGPTAQRFEWPDSDAYGKLTRNHFRVVTLNPVPPNERYLPLRGVYATERTNSDEWRWLAPEAVLRLPHGHGGEVTIDLGLSHDAPYDSVEVNVNERSITVTKDRAATLTAPAGTDDVVIRSAQSFAPATVLHNQDPRILAVQLLRVITR
jgi:hypothetical protein